MAEYTLAHVGINAANEEEALQAAELLQSLFGFPVKNGHSSVFAGTVVEVMKTPGRGTHGHLGIGVDDIQAAVADLEARGYAFDRSTAKYKPDGSLNAIYLEKEVCGFAIHLVAAGR